MRGPEIALVERFYVAFNAGDVETAAGFLAPDFEWRPAIGRSLEGANYYVGPEGFAEYYRDVSETFAGYCVTAVAYEQVDDCVLVDVHVSASGRSSGVRVEHDFTVAYLVHDGLMIRGKTHRAHAAAAAWAREGAPSG